MDIPIEIFIIVSLIEIFLYCRDLRREDNMFYHFSRFTSIFVALQTGSKCLKLVERKQRLQAIQAIQAGRKWKWFKNQNIQKLPIMTFAHYYDYLLRLFIPLKRSPLTTTYTSSYNALFWHVVYAFTYVYAVKVWSAKVPFPTKLNIGCNNICIFIYKGGKHWGITSVGGTV